MNPLFASMLGGNELAYLKEFVLVNLFSRSKGSKNNGWMLVVKKIKMKEKYLNVMSGRYYVVSRINFLREYL